MQELILVRHGQTANNAARLMQGTLDVPLSERGHQQALAAGEALAQHAFDRIFASPLSRALQTAEVIASHHRQSVDVDDNLRERCFGVFQGGPQQDYSNAFAASGMLRWEYRPPQGETIPEVWARAASFLQVLRSSAVGRVAVVAHEGVNKCLILMLLGKPVEEWTSIKQDNCCINAFAFHPDGRLKSHALNQTGHMLAVA